MPDFNFITSQFQFEGVFIGAAPYGQGHIHDTYTAHFHNPDSSIKRYILQQMNTYVFMNPEAVMGNIEVVTRHLRQKIQQSGGNPERETVTLVPAINGSSFFHSESGEYWRAEVFIEGAQSYQNGKSLDHYCQAARAFGRFQKMLGDLEANLISTTIPDFHNTPKRISAFITAVEQDVRNRAHTVQTEIDFILHREADTGILVNLWEQGVLPERVIHNDTKLDNVMIDDVTGEGVCVIDLDTVMPGLSLFDFGDAIRSGANPAAEDEIVLNKVQFDLRIFERYVKGYLDEVRNFLTPSEIDYLAFSARVITLEQAIRFLTDYLNGDVYYKIDRENHNLDRCRTQLKLVADMERLSGEMDELVGRYR